MLVGAVAAIAACRKEAPQAQRFGDRFASVVPAYGLRR